MSSKPLFIIFQPFFSKWPKCSCLQPLSLFLVHHAILHCRPPPDTPVTHRLFCVVLAYTQIICLSPARSSSTHSLPATHHPPSAPPAASLPLSSPACASSVTIAPTTVACSLPRSYAVLSCLPAVLACHLPDDQPSTTSTSPWLASDGLTNMEGGRRR
jgi:hypothetical protein